MRRALPYAVFAAVTLAVFWKFLLLGHTIHAVVLLEQQLGVPAQEPPAWFPAGRPHARVADNIVLLANHLRIYNEGLKAGELRLWNPTLCCGLPIYSDPMVHPFYPPQVVLHATLPPDAAYEVFLLLHLFFSGAALYWLLRGLGRSDLAATAGGLAWMLLGYNSMWFSTGILAGVSVWGPLALLLIHRAFETWNLSRAAMAGVAMGMAILGSHPQHAIHVFLLSLGWLAVVGWKREQGWLFPLRATALYVLLSIGIGMAAILTRLDTIANGYRNPGADLAMFWGDGWALLPHALDVVCGKAYPFDHPFFDYEFSFHAGLAAVALAAWGAARNFRDRHVRLLAIVALASVAVAFLKPLALLLQLVPILSLSPPSRWLFVFGLALSILLAYGWDSLRERPGRAPAAIAAVALLLGTAVLARFRNLAALDTAIGFAIAAAAALASRRFPRPAALLAFAAISFELLPPFLQANWHVDGALMRKTPEALLLARRDGTGPWRGTGSLGGFYSIQAAPRSLDDAAIQDLTDGNNLLALFGMENAAGFEAILPDHYLAFAREAGAEAAVAGRSTAFLHVRSRLVDVMNLEYFFLPRPLPAPAGMETVGAVGTIVIYRNPSVMPRAWLVSRAIAARDEREALGHLRAPGFNPRASVILETGETPPKPGGPAEGGATFERRESDRVELRVTSKDAAFLVLADTDYPGWEADVDGTPTTVYRANVAFRAVAVPAGRHLVTFRFRPDSARTGVIVSALFLALGLGFVAVRRFKRPDGC